MKVLTHEGDKEVCPLEACNSTQLFFKVTRLTSAVSSAPLVLQYHNGSLLTGPGSIKVYILWYGNFSHSQKATVSDFIVSIGKNIRRQPSVSSWWATTQRYKDSARRGVSPVVEIGGQASDALCSRGKKLKRSDTALLVRRRLAKRNLPRDDKGIYIVLTADDVYVERFCMDSCGFHDSIRVTNSKAESKRILVAWVGNSGVQCPGQCAWPFAFAGPLYGPPIPPLSPPNGDVGVDGMIINIASVLVGAATNPVKTGYYQGDAMAPLEMVTAWYYQGDAMAQLEAGTACAGILGKGAYPGYPGKLLVDKKSNARYNAFGIKRRIYVLPAMWNPSTLSCKTTLG
eukprot:PITA_04105